jgi:hypothetical protein
MAGVGAVGNPNEVRKHFRSLEEAGVDQVILLQQGGNYQHEDICESLELLGREVFPEFRERHERRHLEKTHKLGPYIEAANERVAKAEPFEPEVVESYPRIWKKDGAGDENVGVRRAFDAASLWRLHVSGS